MRNFFRVNRARVKAKTSAESFDFLWLAFAAVVLVFLHSRWARAENYQKTIVVKPVVEISGEKSNITLADLVARASHSEAAMKELESVRLADAPKAGETRTFTDLGLAAIYREQVARLEEKTGESYRLKIPSRVTVSRKRNKLSKKAAEAELKREWTGLCPECDFEISNLRVTGESSDSPTEQWVIRTRGELPRGGFSYPVETLDSNGVNQSRWVTGQAMVRRKVPVSTRTLAPGIKLNAGDFTYEMRDITYAIDATSTSEEIEDGLTAKTISVGQILWKASLRRELAVKSGDSVKVTAGKDEEWQISIDGIAQSSGYVGDVVRVKIPRTAKIVSGLLKEKGVVEVQ